MCPRDPLTFDAPTRAFSDAVANPVAPKRVAFTARLRPIRPPGVGLQIVGRHRGEEKLLQATALFEDMIRLARMLPIDPRPGTVPPTS